jgi:hypothetical protein
MSDSLFWDVTVPRVLSTYALVIFIMLWVGFVLALIVNPGWLDSIWDWAQSLPILLQVIVWVVFLPIMVGLWIWESSWPVFVSLLGLAGIVFWTVLAVYSFFKYAR